MKKCVSILLAFILLAAMAVPAFAAQPEGGMIIPRYVAINTIRAYISMNGTTATSSFTVNHSGASANVKLVLQRSADGGKSFTDYSTLSDKSYTTQSIGASASKSGLSTSYTYRTKVVVTVYDAAGKQIDSGTAYS